MTDKALSLARLCSKKKKLWLRHHHGSMMVSTTTLDRSWATPRGRHHATLDIKLEPCPLERREVALLLSCWKRWNTKSVADSAINTWLKGANPEFGPDCEDSPCYGIRKMNVLEVMRLFGECGFEFLPETDLQRRPGLTALVCP